MNRRIVKSLCANWSTKVLLCQLAPAILVLLAMASFAHANVVVKHTGSADPTTESPAWVVGGSGTFGPGGTDTKAYWDITTTTGGDSAGGNAYYWAALSSGDVSGNWLAEATVKAPTLTSGNWGPSDAYLNVYVGSSWYFIGLSDTGLYQSPSTGGYTSQLYAFTPDTSTYYTLSMKKPGAGTSVDVYLDGSLKATITPRAGVDYGNYLYWGDGGSNSGMAGRSHWNSVVFDTNGTPTPEPGTIALLVSGLIGLLCYAWRKRQK